jgi:hypothetical protein
VGERLLSTDAGLVDRLPLANGIFRGGRLLEQCETGALSGTWLSMDTPRRAVEQAVRICHALKRPFGRNLWFVVHSNGLNP